MKYIYMISGMILLTGCGPMSDTNLSDKTIRGANNPCIDNPNTGSEVCVDNSQNLAMIPPIEMAPVPVPAPVTNPIPLL